VFYSQPDAREFRLAVDRGLCQHARMRTLLALALFSHAALAAEPEFPLTEDSKPQPQVAKGTMLKGVHIAPESSVFPGTEREYQIYLPAGFDKTKHAAFMVFQDGVIYQAPVVFDNLIAKRDIPPLVGIFIKPGVVPAANDKALPRYNRSYEYDSITPTYSKFLIEEFLPAIEAQHGIQLSTDPNHAAISGNSSGGICAFMAAWHRPDRFRRVFTGVGTYVGIHGADQLPVLVRKFEPKPLRVFLQSGTGDNNLYCGDWWMANQTMERSLTWAGYDVNHAWGEGGHNAKHASQIFPDVLRWLWRDWQTNIEIKANAKGESKWKGYEVVGEGEWELAAKDVKNAAALTAEKNGDIIAIDTENGDFWRLSSNTEPKRFGSGHRSDDHGLPISRIVVSPNGKLIGTGPNNHDGMSIIGKDGKLIAFDASSGLGGWSLCVSHDGWFYLPRLFGREILVFPYLEEGAQLSDPERVDIVEHPWTVALSPDQTQLYVVLEDKRTIHLFKITKEHKLVAEQSFVYLEVNDEGKADASGLCVDTNGWLYVATSLGIQVCDQAGRVNFIIPTPMQPFDICFGGKDLSELFIACGDAIYKRPTKAHGIVSGQMAPITPPKPKL